MIAGRDVSTFLDVPLCVDLDQTLVSTSVSHECVLSCIRRNPLLLFVIPFWLVKGRVYFWARLARCSVVDPATLPYRPEVLAYIQAEKRRGRDVVLVTSAHRLIAERVADYLGVFSRVVATDDSQYCAAGIQAARLVDLFGAAGFDYAAASRRSLPVWYAAGIGILVNATRAAGSRLDRVEIPHTSLDCRNTPAWAALIRAIRPHQAVKNLLVFAPVFLSHRWGEPRVIANALLTFAALCCASFAGYIINDLLDLEADRHHATKRTRPIAAGMLAIPVAGLLAVALLAAALGLGLAVSVEIATMVSGYLLITLLYSLWLKTVVAVDVALLAGLYCYRVYAGGVATGIPISPWTLAFSLFLFLSLALMKRYAELHAASTGAASAKRRQYRDADKPTLVSLGNASALTSILVIALYANSTDVRILYKAPNLLWLVCPLVLVWIMRLWFIAGRGEMHEDPVLYAVSDPWTYGLALASVAAVFASI